MVARADLLGTVRRLSPEPGWPRAHLQGQRAGIEVHEGRPVAVRVTPRTRAACAVLVVEVRGRGGARSPVSVDVLPHHRVGYHRQPGRDVFRLPGTHRA